MTDKYAALEVDILVSQADVNLQMGRYAEADAIGRALLSLTARAHMDAHLARAMDLVTKPPAAKMGGPAPVPA